MLNWGVPNLDGTNQNQSINDEQTHYAKTS